MILSAGIDKFWLHIIIVNHCVWAILLLLVKQSLNLLPLTNAWTQGWWNLIWFNNHCSQLSWHWWGCWHYGLEYQYQILVFTGRQYLLRMWFTQNYVNSDWGVWPTLLKERVLPPPGHPPLQGTTLNEHSLPGMLKNPFCPGHLSSLHSGPGNECPPVAQL